MPKTRIPFIRRLVAAAAVALSAALATALLAASPAQAAGTCASGGSGTMNVAYDLWLHPMSNPGSSNNPTDEIMIWPYRSGGAGPAGTYQTTVNIGGASWDLYRGWIDAGNGVGWNVFSFIRTSNTTSVNRNLRDFTGDMIWRGWLSGGKYLSSVQAGTEVFIGSGRVDTNSYWVDVQ